MQMTTPCQSRPPTADEVLLNLKHDCDISLLWYKQNGMEANPNKFQFLISSPYTAENMELKLKIDKNITLAPAPFVKLLGIYIDSRLTFTDHVSSCCNKAARQLNALSRISKYLDLNCRKLISGVLYWAISHIVLSSGIPAANRIIAK